MFSYKHITLLYKISIISGGCRGVSFVSMETPFHILNFILFFLKQLLYNYYDKRLCETAGVIVPPVFVCPLTFNMLFLFLVP